MGVPGEDAADLSVYSLHGVRRQQLPDDEVAQLCVLRLGVNRHLGRCLAAGLAAPDATRRGWRGGLEVAAGGRQAVHRTLRAVPVPMTDLLYRVMINAPCVGKPPQK